MKKNTSSLLNKSIKAEAQVLLKRADKLIKEIDKIAKDFTIQLNKIDADVKKSTATLKKIYFDLNQIEKEAESKIDKLISEQTKALDKD
ncbi:MAG TPA: hypothetical protein ENL27_02970 [Candidatus Parcubacteria bacterium]|nr:hypothetical protein [Candidatus Parcubacteria bacterium]